MPKAIEVVGQEQAERAAKAFNEWAARMVGDAPQGYDELRELAKKPATADDVLIFETNAYRRDPAPEAAGFMACVGRSAPLNCWGDGVEHETPAAALEGFAAWCDRSIRMREPSPADMSDSALQR